MEKQAATLMTRCSNKTAVVEAEGEVFNRAVEEATLTRVEALTITEEVLLIIKVEQEDSTTNSKEIKVVSITIEGVALTTGIMEEEGVATIRETRATLAVTRATRVTSMKETKAILDRETKATMTTRGTTRVDKEVDKEDMIRVALEARVEDMILIRVTRATIHLLASTTITRGTKATNKIREVTKTTREVTKTTAEAAAVDVVISKVVEDAEEELRPGHVLLTILTMSLRTSLC